MILIADYFIYQLSDKKNKKYVADVNLIDGVVRINEADYDTEDGIGRPELVIELFGDIVTIQMDHYRFTHNKQQKVYTTQLNKSDRKIISQVFEKYKNILA